MKQLLFVVKVTIMRLQNNTSKPAVTYSKQQLANRNTIDITEKSSCGPTLKEFKRCLKKLCTDDRVVNFID
jgi:hypothetical protein